jgi:hypothetical protein
MYNLIITAILLGTTAVYWGFQHQNLRAIRQANQMAMVTSQKVHRRGETARQELAAVTHAEQGVLADIRTAKQGLAREDVESAAPLDPAHEGSWPPGRPYFYIAKKRLADIGWAPFGISQKLDNSAAALLGLSAAESDAVNRIYGQFQQQVSTLRQQRSKPVVMSGTANTETHREIAFRIAEATEEMTALRQGLATDLRRVLGDTRGILLFNRASENMIDVYGFDGDRASLVSLTADRAADGAVTHSLKMGNEGGDSKSVGVFYPIGADSPLWNYRHLFGSEPLFPLPLAQE